MRETLFRAAQPTGTTPSEELVGQLQDPDLTRRCWDQSLAPITTTAAATVSAHAATILWPYPAGTADCVDRANCADHFLRANPGYHVVTPLGLAHPDVDRLLDGTDVVLFLPFEDAADELSIVDNHLQMRGRQIDAVISELAPGYLWRHGILDLDPHQPSWPLDTQLINGSLLAAHKGQQAHHFATYCQQQPGIVALDTIVVATVEELTGALERTLDGSRAAVIRPFSASQGTGVTFVDRDDITRRGGPYAAAHVVEQISAALARKYGSPAPFPLIVTPFTEAARLNGCVTDLRIFVCYDPTSDGLRGLPGMVRRAQLPLADTGSVTAAAALTNLNAAPVTEAIPGPRFFPATDPQILTALGLTPDDLVRLCEHATAIWATASQSTEDPDGRGPFAYGSVDFVIRRTDARAVPIEMNGTNVGSHPTVHPRWCHAFGAATTHALTQLGFAR
ncbi:hypothetical protein FHR83_005463 [Actinoplanes campanulatus]|uniref:ATP-grasp domain-containing protein n=1 Tax=Actinoplanes campanulatus TaxID=113559 RepID=A0A7W5FGQ4_9ACTN|nr:hypothetical protein [Actinoplanes campanulatus]MBB3097779.1 hypothetical protein [Actinoplanes campanulatus]GGN38276.1 hypothetical protein GCM10010109_65020 [Actinoplanes campanulatus]GID39652.1 hypothetical protein Aca09nite_61580 [Actinoplanes campanulatus]